MCTHSTPPTPSHHVSSAQQKYRLVSVFVLCTVTVRIPIEEFLFARTEKGKRMGCTLHNKRATFFTPCFYPYSGDYLINMHNQLQRAATFLQGLTYLTTIMPLACLPSFLPSFHPIPDHLRRDTRWLSGRMRQRRKRRSGDSGSGSAGQRTRLAGRAPPTSS